MAVAVINILEETADAFKTGDNKLSNIRKIIFGFSFLLLVVAFMLGLAKVECLLVGYEFC